MLTGSSVHESRERAENLSGSGNEQALGGRAGVWQCWDVRCQSARGRGGKAKGRQPCLPLL